VYKKLNSTGTLIQRTTTEAPQGHMYYIGLDVHKKTISYCVKDASGQVHQEGQVGATRWELDGWMKTLPQPWTVAMEATDFHRLDLRSSTSACPAGAVPSVFLRPEMGGSANLNCLN
jgi:hypothetical protein